MQVVVFAVSFLFYVALAPQEFINADAVVYAEQIRAANFSERTTHLAYYVVAYPVTLLPIPLDYALNLLNCLFGAGVVLLVALLAEAVTKSRKAAWVAAGVTLSNSVVAYNAMHAEAYISQAFFLLLAMYLWQLRLSAATGVAAAVAFLVSASAALAAPYFVIVRPRLKPLAILSAVSALLTVAALAPVIQNYLYGARGLMSAAGAGVDYQLATLKTGQDLFFGYFTLLPFLLAGVVACWRFNRTFLIAVSVLFLVTFAAGEKFVDVPVQLTTYALGSVLVAIGVTRLSPVMAWVCAALVPLILLTAHFTPVRYADHLPDTLELSVFLAAVVLIGLLRQRGLVIGIAANLLIIGSQAAEIRRELSDFSTLAQKIRQAESPVIVAKWNEMVRMNWLVHGTAYHDSSFLPEAFEPTEHTGKPTWKLEPR